MALDYRARQLCVNSGQLRGHIDDIARSGYPLDVELMPNGGNRQQLDVLPLGWT
jgi:hypothetical protein